VDLSVTNLNPALDLSGGVARTLAEVLVGGLAP
jgi:hypothetical protein